MHFRSGTLTILVALSALIGAGCTGPSSLNWTITDDVDYGHLNLDIDESKLNESNRSLGLAIKAKKTVDFKDVTKALVAQHTSSFNAQHSRGENANSVLAQINQISHGLRGDVFKIKTDLDSKMDQMTGKSWRYNKNEASIVARLKENKSQCYSGTVLFELVNRVKGRTQYLRSNPVTIFTSGHVLPGVVTQGRGGQKMLTGIETTVKGRGEIVMGLASEVNESRRVVLAEDFVIIEILKDAIKNSAAVVAAAEKKAEERYGIKSQAPAEAASVGGASAQGGSGASAQGSDAVLNASPFAFGSTSHIPDGDQVPENLDRRDRSLQSTKNSSAAVSAVAEAQGPRQRLSRAQITNDEALIRRLYEHASTQSVQVTPADLNAPIVEQLLREDFSASAVDRTAIVMLAEDQESLCNAAENSEIRRNPGELVNASVFCEPAMSPMYNSGTGYMQDSAPYYVAQIRAVMVAEAGRQRQRGLRKALGFHHAMNGQRLEVPFEFTRVDPDRILNFSAETASQETLTTIFGANVLRTPGVRIYRVRITKALSRAA